MSKRYEVVIVGGGFYGLRIAQFLHEEIGLRRVLVVEKEKDVMTRSSYNNQARVHNGYHYPRSVLTALRSRVNLPVFFKEYEEAVVRDFDKYYAVARVLSKVSAVQFRRFFERLGAEIEVSPQGRDYFNPKYIEEVFRVKEYAFNTSVLRDKLLRRIDERGIELHTDESAELVEKRGKRLAVITDKAGYAADSVINCSYASLNRLHVASGLPVLPLKHELTEMCLVQMPSELRDKAFTIMCGPFFSLMPFPARAAYTMSHVRYTPHAEWSDTEQRGHSPRNAAAYKTPPPTRFAQMHADIKRYMPHAAGITYTGESLWEVKTVLPQSEGDDSRPIMYRAHHGNLKNYLCVMGGKIDNVYDVFKELTRTYGQAG